MDVPVVTNVHYDVTVRRRTLIMIMTSYFIGRTQGPTSAPEYGAM